MPALRVIRAAYTGAAIWVNIACRATSAVLVVAATGHRAVMLVLMAVQVDTVTLKHQSYFGIAHDCIRSLALMVSFPSRLRPS